MTPGAAADPAACSDAAAEQRWNEAALAQPVAAPAWRLWTYAQPAVVLGRSQRAWAAEAAAASPLEVVVRSAGGGAVLVGPWLLGLSALLPASHPLAARTPVASYRWLGEGVADALHEVGVGDALALPPEAVRGRQPPGAPPDWACFGGLSPWEVVAGGGRKIAGLAQVRRRVGVLLVAGVLLDAPPWPALCRALRRDDAEAERLRLTTVGAATLAATPADTLRERLRGALALRLQRALAADGGDVSGPPAAGPAG